MGRATREAAPGPKVMGQLSRVCRAVKEILRAHPLRVCPASVFSGQCGQPGFEPGDAGILRGLVDFHDGECAAQF